MMAQICRTPSHMVHGLPRGKSHRRDWRHTPPWGTPTNEGLGEKMTVPSRDNWKSHLMRWWEEFLFFTSLVRSFSFSKVLDSFISSFQRDSEMIGHICMTRTTLVTIPLDWAHLVWLICPQMEGWVSMEICNFCAFAQVSGSPCPSWHLTRTAFPGDVEFSTCFCFPFSCQLCGTFPE